jgi:hypothetical protein
MIDYGDTPALWEAVRRRDLRAVAKLSGANMHTGYTFEHYRCRDCEAIGSAIGQLFTDWVPYGDRRVPMQTLQAPFYCEACGSERLVPVHPLEERRAR